MSKMTIAQAQASHPLDLSALDNVTDPEEYDRVLHDAIRNQLKAGGLISPTENTTNFELQHEDTVSFADAMARKVVKAFPAVFDDPNEGGRRYMEERFKRITAHEGWESSVYKDRLNVRTIGYGFNMDEPTNRNLFKQALKSDDKHFDDLREGRKELSRREGRILFEASVGHAEKLISQRFSDVDLKGYQRLALVSLAYNHPSLIGPNLTRHIKAGNFEAAKDEILNRSNKYKLKGIQNRRIDEANLFSGMHEDEGDSDFSVASLLGISEAQASTRSDGNIKFPRPKMKPITNFGNLETTVKSSEEDADDDGFFDKALKIASDFFREILTVDFETIPTPALMIARSVFDTKEDVNKTVYRKSDFDWASQDFVQELYNKAKAAGRDFVIYEDYGKLANGLSVKALLGDATKINPKTGDYYRDKNGKEIYFPDLREKLREERERYYTPNFTGLVRMATDMQSDPKFRVAGAIGRFQIQRSEKGDFIRERWNFNSKNVAKARDLFGQLREYFGERGAPISEKDGPLVLFPLSGDLTISDLEKGGKI